MVGEDLLALTGTNIRARRIVRALLGMIAKLNDRVDRVASSGTELAGQVIRLDLVATAADLPASAPARQWYRVQGDLAIYVGNGSGKPLTKVTTTLP